MIKSLALTTSALFAIGTLGAQAGGFELSPLSTAFMYEDGGYAEIGYSSRNYTVTDNRYAPTGSAVQDQSNTSLAFKFDLNDAFSVGLSRYRQGSIQLDYSSAGNPAGTGNPTTSVLPVVDLDIDATVGLLRYQVNENFSAFGGFKRSTVNDATANIFRNSTAPTTGISNVTGASETGYVYGIAYQRDDIALRIELTKETATDFALATSNADFPDGITTASVPDYLNLAFQSGVAKDTLVFGSIRKANWASNQITVWPQQVIPGAGPTTSTFSDTTTYNIGVGRKINDDLSAFVSYSTEAGGDGNETSLLNVSNGYKGISLGVAYSLGNATITFGGNYTKLGDVNMDIADDGTFESSFAGNTVKSLGLKVAYNF